MAKAQKVYCSKIQLRLTSALEYILVIWVHSQLLTLDLNFMFRYVSGINQILSFLCNGSEKWKNLGCNSSFKNVPCDAFFLIFFFVRKGAYHLGEGCGQFNSSNILCLDGLSKPVKLSCVQ